MIWFKSCTLIRSECKEDILRVFTLQCIYLISSFKPVPTLQWTEDYTEKSHILAFAPLEEEFWNAVYIKTFQNKTHF
jgi:hypothetical protein